MGDQLEELRVSNDAKNHPEELQHRIDDEGYLFFKQLQNPSKLLELRRQILTTLQDGGWLIHGTDPMDGITDVTKVCTEGDREYTDVYHHVQKLEAFHRSAHWPEVTQMIDRIMGRPAMPQPQKIARIWFPQYTEHTTPTHQDFVHFQGTFEALTLWAPIGDCPIELGGLAVLPGSHKVGEVLDHHFSLGAGGLNVDVEEEAKRHEEVAGSWHTTNYEVGDTLIFPALTIHKALPNVTEDRMRVSLDNRYHPIGETIAEHMLTPHLNNDGEFTWEDVYPGWESEDLKYYWRQHDNPVVPTITEYGEKRFAESLELARSGDTHAILSLQRTVKNNLETPNGLAARGVLREIGALN